MYFEYMSDKTTEEKISQFFKDFAVLKGDSLNGFNTPVSMIDFILFISEHMIINNYKYSTMTIQMVMDCLRALYEKEEIFLKQRDYINKINTIQLRTRNIDSYLYRATVDGTDMIKVKHYLEKDNEDERTHIVGTKEECMEFYDENDGIY